MAVATAGPASGAHPAAPSTQAAPNCAALHPADLIPLRSAERNWNFVCSSQHRPSAVPLSGGGGPPGFGIYNLAMTYDAHDGYLLLLGATGVGPNNGTQTWTFVHDNWTQLTPSMS